MSVTGRRYVIGVRPITLMDLAQVETWLREPHVAQWWTDPPETEIETYRQRITGEADAPTVMLVITEEGRPIGWCQWYRWDRYPDDAEAMEARPGEVGIDYAIGEPTAVGRGVGTDIIAALVAWVRRHEPGAGVLADPDAANWPSRRVLERNGFELVAVRPVASEPTDHPMAIYRLPGTRANAAVGDSVPARVLLVDAANVVGSRPTGWWRDRAGAAGSLVDRLVAAIADGRLDPPVVVVLEGAARAGAPEGETDGITVAHAVGSGDDRVVELAAASVPAPVVVVTADRELRRRITAVGGSVVGPDWLYQRLLGRDGST
jgi:RimJ/RimL family protein N-acetyltransferase